MSEPQVSIVLPVWNARDTLDECIDSIAAQSCSSFEVVVVDDGSTDGSGQVLSRWSDHDPRVRYLRQNKSGIVSALNAGLAMARGEFVARMDADDIMYPSRLQVQLEYLRQHPGIDLVATQVNLFPQHKIQAGFAEYIRWQNRCVTNDDVRDEIYIESPFAHPSVMYRKQVVVRLGGYREGHFPEDYELWLRMMHAGCGMAKISTLLLDWREDETRATRVDPRYSRNAFDQLRADYLFRDPRIRGDRPLAYWGAGRKTRRRSGLLVDKGLKPAVWIDIDERKIGNVVRGARVVSPDWLQQSHARKPFVLGYVTNHGARDLIAQQLSDFGYQRGQDYLMVG